MATAATLIQRVRRRVGDWPDLDALTASIAGGGVTATVTTSVPYYKLQKLEIEDEVLQVTALPSGTTLTVRRAMEGSVDVSHANGSAILRDPRFTKMEILDVLNDGIDQMWPYFYREVVDTTSIVPNGTTEEFSVPVIADLGGIQIPRLRSVELKMAGMVPFWYHTHWSVVRAGQTSKIKFNYAPPTGATCRVRGYAPLEHLANSADTLDPGVPYNAEDLPVIWAVGELLATGEARRVRVDTGVIDTREQAVRPGSSLNVARDRRQLFYLLRAENAMSPMQPHIVLKP